MWHKLIMFWKNFFVLIWDVIKSMKTIRGMIALFLSYMIFQGWAVLFLLLGNTWMKGIGAMVIAFWFGPGTPTIPLIFMTALFIQRYIFMDKENQVKLKEKWHELNKKEEMKGSDKDVI